jgi:hypothetical protein
VIAVPAGIRSGMRRSTMACFRLIKDHSGTWARKFITSLSYVWQGREIIEFVEATCDEVALQIERRITTASGLTVTRRRDIRRDSPLGQPVDDRRAIHVGSAASAQADRP